MLPSLRLLITIPNVASDLLLARILIFIDMDMGMVDRVDGCTRTDLSEVLNIHSMDYGRASSFCRIGKVQG